MQTIGQLSSWLMPITCVFESNSNEQTQDEPNYWQSNLTGKIRGVTRQQFRHLMNHSFPLDTKENLQWHQLPHNQLCSIREPERENTADEPDPRLTVHYRLDLHKLQSRMAGLGFIVGMWLASNDLVRGWQVIALAIISGGVVGPAMKAERVHHHLIGGLITAACFTNIGLSSGASFDYALRAAIGQPVPSN